MGFATVARVTEDRWVACAVKDNINFGLKVGGELKVETTLCHEVREFREEIVVDDFELDSKYKGHHTPLLYGLRSYISVPIWLKGGRFFGTLCAIDPNPAAVNNPETIGMFNLYAELISMHFDNYEQLEAAQTSLSQEKEIAVLREQFIAVLSHDLRNPVGAVKNVAQLMHRGRLDEAGTKRFAGVLLNSHHRMMGLINNLTDFARGRMGAGIVLQQSAEQMELPLRHVVEELQLIWPEREIDLQTDLEHPVYCDSKRVAQLFSNLLGNALIHGAADGPILINAESGPNKFLLFIQNSGKPIPESIMANIFQPFAKGHEKPGQDGLGLGLYIASEIARAHGGTLEVRSDDETTIFTFTTPNNIYQ
ncbi:GAF domain-containing sensor histidine kinase [Mucilaginibacter myungsuensis]|uniref:histidine kinase n=2 Tax=Mucilaginibacter myungsuensis TaxID=649104 RepID=A0A929KVL3_9SPHI|nr:GAF domain-containing sensor histidine kinase [Mucilaginibacter myungsuensis]